MKKTIKSIMSLMSLALIASSCSSDLSDDVNVKKGGNLQPMTFTATQESSNMPSRTAISGTAINWQAGDKITIWDGTNKNEFTATPSDPATGATLTGEAAASGTFTAVYPHSIGQYSACSGTAITNNLVIPTFQTATAGTYDPAAAVMTAYTTGTTLAFKNVCSFLKLTTSAAYNKIVVSVTSGNIAGTFSLEDASATSPVLTCTKGITKVTLKPSSLSSEAKIAAGTYYIAIAPGTYSGLKIDCYTDVSEDISYIERSKASSVTFDRNKVYDMGNTESGWTTHYNVAYDYVDLGLSVKWATCNVGAITPDDNGDYFAWGEKSPYYTSESSLTWEDGKENGYDFSSYSFGQTASSLTKYIATDKKTILESSDDAATANWGGSWRMPTQEEFDELKNNCYCEWTKNYKATGKRGYIVYKAKDDADKGKMKNDSNTPDLTGTYSLSDTHIFLPTTSCLTGTDIYSEIYEYVVGSAGYYWSSTVNSSKYKEAYRVYLGYGAFTISVTKRNTGQCVRPVCP